MKILLLLIVLSCKACGANDYTSWGTWWDINSISTIKVYVSTQFPATIRTLIITNVIDQWNSHTQNCGFSIQFTDDWSTSNIMIVIDTTIHDIGGFDAIASTKPLCFDHTSGQLDHNICHPSVKIYVAEPNFLQSNNIDIYTVLRHEMGHALGLGHTKNSDCLMHPYYYGPRDIGTGEDNGLVCIYGSLFGDRVKPSAGSDHRIQPLGRRHVSIKILQGACNGDGTGGADSAKIKMNFYHSNKSMTWETIKSFNFASRYYEDSIVVELPPDDSNYTGWRVIRSYTYFPDTVIETESDTFNFNTLQITEKRPDIEKTLFKKIKIYTNNHTLTIQNTLNQEIQVTIYNTIGQSCSSLLINGTEAKSIKMNNGLYFVRIKYNDMEGHPKVYVKPVHIVR